MKDGSRLFKNIPDIVYESVFNELTQLRKDFPSYRDDQLLMYLICTDRMKEAVRG